MKVVTKKVGFWFLVFGLWLLLMNFQSFAQSTNQSFPTAVTTNEINGSIKARDVGDARLTTYFYAFNGNQGDVFINVVTKNFDGDIDVFTADNLRPLTKIVVYSDSSDNETGRVIYLRQATKMILRIQGRSPNNEAAEFRIKFAGSFQPLLDTANVEEPKLPEIKPDENSGIRVNSVGTIIEVKPKPTPQPVEKTEEKEIPKEEVKTDESETVAKQDDEVEKTEEKTDDKEKSETEKSQTKPEVVVTDNLPKTEEKETPEEKPETKTAKVKTPKTVKPKTKTAKKNDETPKEPNPLENIRLIVLFKDGTKIERPMSEVLKVSVDKGILTIINKDGSIGRYSILDVAKMTIE